ncbi:uncharacterized protein LOC136089338 [Hydra vulgaris]|uniref:Uncharacterized protein LOC136089338 n=1 Tax=Hydra vulgaris TaxID=6087 RepID=A0ABM4DAK5_HYDVU
MSSCYKARKYKDYTNNDLSKCLEEVKCKKLTQKQAAAKYGISRRTICYKLKGKHNLKPGKPYFFSKFEEAAFVKCTIQLSDFGFPIGKEDLHHIMNNYLISSGKKVKEFKIFPWPDLVNSFLQRHPWCEGGLKGVRYFNTKSGWFDRAAFEEWFFSIVLPSLKKKSGVKVLLGDNLSSHISPKVINACEKNEILFVCLPPNSTHITQPLDVAFFKPLKTAWRRIITEYKDSPAGCTKTSLEKQHFPELLNKLLIAIEPNQANNLKSGFRKCGI